MKHRLGVVGVERGVDPALVVVRGRVVGVDRQRLVEVLVRGVGGGVVLAVGAPLGPAERGEVVGLVGRALDDRLQVADRLAPLLAGHQLLGDAEAELGIDRGRDVDELAARELAIVGGAARAVGELGARGVVRLADVVDPRCDRAGRRG